MCSCSSKICESTLCKACDDVSLQRSAPGVLWNSARSATARRGSQAGVCSSVSVLRFFESQKKPFREMRWSEIAGKPRLTRSREARHQRRCGGVQGPQCTSALRPSQDRAAPHAARVCLGRGQHHQSGGFWAVQRLLSCVLGQRMRASHGFQGPNMIPRDPKTTPPCARATPWSGSPVAEPPLPPGLSVLVPDRAQSTPANKLDTSIPGRASEQHSLLARDRCGPPGALQPDTGHRPVPARR